MQYEWTCQRHVNCLLVLARILNQVLAIFLTWEFVPPLSWYQRFTSVELGLSESGKPFPQGKGWGTCLGEQYQAENWFLLGCRDKVNFHTRWKILVSANLVLAVRTHEDRAGMQKKGLLKLLLFCSCFPTVFLRIQATLCSWTLSLPIFVWLYETHRTLCMGESCAKQIAGLHHWA